MKDLTNQQYHDWTFLRFDSRNESNHEYWLVKCVCGFERVSYCNHILSGKSKRCKACSYANRIKTDPEIRAFKALLHNYKLGAKTRGLVWDLDQEYVKSLFRANCYYCNTPAPNESIYFRSPTSYRYNGLDRLNNTVGYTKNNTVTCCSICNRMKGTLNETDFITKCAAIHEWMHNS